jgi:hypothetical protein
VVVLLLVVLQMQHPYLTGIYANQGLKQNTDILQVIPDRF